MSIQTFDYEQAFSRNIGLFTEAQQRRLHEAAVSVAGMGGVGGDYVATLARAGIGRFRIADFDRFELANFNRQYGATMDTIGRPKVEVMAEWIRAINPQAEVEVWQDPVTSANVDAFIGDSGVVVDGIDLFAPDAHALLVRRAVTSGRIVWAAVPVGFGAGMVGFGPGSMTFDDYFDFPAGGEEWEKVLMLALGFSPAGFHLRYLDPSSVDLRARRGPSSVTGCKLCAGMLVTQVLWSILDPQSVRLAPWYVHFDARLVKLRHGRLVRGNRGVVQRLKRYLARRKFG